MVEVKKLKTPYKDWLQPLSSIEFSALESDIKLRGVLQAVITDDEGNILDGHHRYKCDKNAPTVQLQGLSEAEKQAFVMSSNNKRRNLSPEQKAENRTRSIGIANALKKEDPKKWTQARISVALGVHHDTVSEWLSISNSESRIANNDARVSVPKSQRSVIVARAKTGEKQGVIAADFGISQGRVAQLITQETKRKENTP